MGPDFWELDKIIEDMKKVGLDLTVKGDMSDFLGINNSNTTRMAQST